MNTSAIARPLRLFASLLAGLALFAPAGCSISTSPSDSSRSSSDSSTSSSPESKETAYRNDVRDYTAAYVKSGGQFADFQKKLGDLARERGITNWEDDMATYEGVGQGLGKAKVSQAEVSAYVDNLAKGDGKKAEAIRKGYESAKE